MRGALDALKTVNIVIPVWDDVTGSGNDVAYRVVSFARVRVTDYDLASANRISARFLGYVTCADATPISRPEPFTAVMAALSRTFVSIQALTQTVVVSRQ